MKRHLLILGIGIGIAIGFVAPVLAAQVITVEQIRGAFWKTQGAGAAGAALSGNPVLIAGSDGTNARIPKVDDTNNAMYTAPIAQSYFPIATTSNVAVSTTTAAITGLTAESCKRVVCSVDVFYRTGTGTPTAVTTDAFLPANTVERACLASGGTAFAFITASGTGTCYASDVVLGP